MKIPLESFKSILRNPDSIAIAAFIKKIALTYDITLSDAVKRYNRIAHRSKFFELRSWITCSWSETPIPAHGAMTDSQGNYMSYTAYSSMGCECSHCSSLHQRTWPSIKKYISHRGNSGFICDKCIENNAGRFIYNESDNTYYHRNHPSMTAKIDLSNIIYPDRSRLYESYQPGRIRLETKVSTELHNCMLNYSANPIAFRPSFIYREDEGALPINPLWMGVELEVSPNDKALKTPGFFHKVASSLKEFAITKSDGSLPFGGFEICTVPATLSAHKNLWKDFFQNVAPLLRSWGMGNDKPHGMHVHLNKSFLTPSEIGKALIFVNSNENRNFIEKVAGRGQTTYTTYYPKKYKDVKNNSRNHYDALSISNHTGVTIELRIFRGNVSEPGFLKNLEFAHALCHFAKDTSAKELMSFHFMEWISDPQNRGNYPYFVGWAQKHKLLKKLEDNKVVEIPEFSVGQTKELVEGKWVEKKLVYEDA